MTNSQVNGFNSKISPTHNDNPEQQSNDCHLSTENSLFNNNNLPDDGAETSISEGGQEDDDDEGEARQTSHGKEVNKVEGSKGPERRGLRVWTRHVSVESESSSSSEDSSVS